MNPVPRPSTVDDIIDVIKHLGGSIKGFFKSYSQILNQRATAVAEVMLELITSCPCYEV
jgi:hypothetical protein